MKSFPIERFGGLNLSEDEQEINGVVARNLLNVELDLDGRLRRRDGLVAHNTSVLSSTGYSSLHPAAVGVGYLIAGRYVGGASLQLDRMAHDGTMTNIGNVASVSSIAVSSAATFG